MKIKNLKRIPVIILTIVIFVLSSLKQKIPPIGAYKIDYLFIVLHIGEFGLFSMLLMLGFYPQFKSYYLVMGCILYGILDEIHQYFVPTRFFDVLDILCNIVGAILGVLIYFLLLYIIIKIRTPKWAINIMSNEVNTIEQFIKILEKED